MLPALSSLTGGGGLSASASSSASGRNEAAFGNEFGSSFIVNTGGAGPWGALSNAMPMVALAVVVWLIMRRK